jgi:hypothetical protein
MSPNDAQPRAQAAAVRTLELEAQKMLTEFESRSRRQ